MKSRTSRNGEAQKDVARRIYITDILSYDENRSRGFNVERFGKVKVFGTALDKKLFRSDTKVDYAFVSIDDVTASAIRLKVWGADSALLDEAELGIIIDVVGRVRYGKVWFTLSPK